METNAGIAALAALAQPIRFETFRLLAEHEPDGLPAGQVARHLGIPQSTMSMNFAVLLRTGLVTARRDGRSIVYRASLNRLRAVILFLVRDCSGSSEDLCGPLVDELLPALTRRSARDWKQSTLARLHGHSGAAHKGATAREGRIASAAARNDDSLRRANRRSG
jgi:DNA-binding transcriptional ArsR family regulator